MAREQQPNQTQPAPEQQKPLLEKLVVNRRALGILTVSTTLGITQALKVKQGLAGGGGPPYNNPTLRELNNEEVRNIFGFSFIHEQLAKESFETYFSKTLRERYGYQINEVSLFNMVQDRASNTQLPTEDYNITSKIQLSSVDAVDIHTQSRHQPDGSLREFEFRVDIPQRGEKRFYIPELDRFLTPMARGPWVILERDFEPLLKAAFDLPPTPTSTSYLLSNGETGRSWYGKSLDNKYDVIASISSSKTLTLVLRSNPTP